MTPQDRAMRVSCDVAGAGLRVVIERTTASVSRKA
jgi:hypothetical protein